MYMDEPLSAMIRPYCFKAFRIVWLIAEYEAMLKLDFRRRRMPMGGAEAFDVFEAQCEAGGTKAARLDCSVNRSACLI